MTFNLPVFSRILQAVPDAPPVYLIGGAVRDVILGKPSHDLDFGVDGNALAYARKLANALGGAYYPLDIEHETARIILEEESGERTVLDFARLRGQTLEEDLRLRDFTFNAIAMDVRSPELLIDPLKGALDLRSKRLRACSDLTFQNDPNRVLRALRQAVALGAMIEPQTLVLLKNAVGLLPSVSAERQRDEVFRILAGRKPASVFRSMEMLGVLEIIFPELFALVGLVQSSPHIQDVWSHTLDVVTRLDMLLEVLNPSYNPDKAATLPLGMAVVRVGRYRDQIGALLETALTPDRNLRSLLFLAALFHDVGKPVTRSQDQDGRIRFFNHDEIGAELAFTRAAKMRLSNLESDRLKAVVRYHMRPLLFTNAGEQPSRKSIYRFFRQAGEAGIDICLISMADYLGTYGAGMDQKEWRKHLDVIRSLFSAWWDTPHEVVAPPSLLTGHDLINQFGLKPGPVIGDLLEALREAQAVGEIQSREAALAFIQERVGG